MNDIEVIAQIRNLIAKFKENEECLVMPSRIAILIPRGHLVGDPEILEITKSLSY